MDKDQLVYSITLEWMYNVIKGNHEKAHDVICKMAGKDPELIHNIFCIASFTFSNLVGVLKSLDKKNQDVITELCEAMISDESPKDVLDQFMCEEDYNDPDDFEPPSKFAGAPFDPQKDLDGIRKAIDEQTKNNRPRKRSTKTRNENPVNDLPKIIREELDRSRRENSKLTNLKFVGVTFDYKKKDVGEKQVNDALADGYRVIETIKTESGIVLVMGLYRGENHD